MFLGPTLSLYYNAIVFIHSFIHSFIHWSCLNTTVPFILKTVSYVDQEILFHRFLNLLQTGPVFYWDVETTVSVLLYFINSHRHMFPYQDVSLTKICCSFVILPHFYVRLFEVISKKGSAVFPVDSFQHKYCLSVPMVVVRTTCAKF